MAKLFAAIVVVADASCKGTADPAEPGCYEGSAGALGLTENVKVNVKAVGAGVGTIDFSGSGIEGFTCSDRGYSKSGSDLSLDDCTDCLPSGITVPSVKYCSDTDTVQVKVVDKVVPFPITATLKKVSCSASTSTEFASCTGSDDPVITQETCYTGKAGALGLTETVTVNLKSYASGAGTLDYSGTGIEAFTCTGKTLTKSGQDISFSDSTDCLPSGITVSAVKYCSDSDTIKVTVKDKVVPFPISAILSKVACASSVEV